MASNQEVNDPGAAQPPRDALLDGQSYLASLRDAREVYIYGERVRDVTEHPAFRNSCRSIARLYDALHDSKTRDTLTGPDRTGMRTHKFFKPCYSAQESVGGARRHRGLVAPELRLHGPHARLQSGAHGQPGDGTRVLRAVR